MKTTRERQPFYAGTRSISAPRCRALVKKPGRWDNQSGCSEYREIALTGYQVIIVGRGSVEVECPSMFAKRSHVRREAVSFWGKAGDIFVDDRGRPYVLAVDVPEVDPDGVVLSRFQEETHRAGMVTDWLYPEEGGEP